MNWPDVASPLEAWDRLTGVRDPEWSEEEQVWIVHNPDQVEMVARETQKFSSCVPGPRDVRLDFLLTTDGLDHKWQRAVFLRHFAPRIHAASNKVQVVAEELFKLVDTSGSSVDLHSEISVPLGEELCRQIVGGFSPDEFQHANKDSRDILGSLLGQFKSDAGASPFLGLRKDLSTRGQSPQVYEGQIIGLAVAIVSALKETLPAAISLSIARSLSGEVVSLERPFKTDTPLLGLYRSANQDCRIGDRHITRGECLFLAWGAANHKSEYVDYTFGCGPHHCPAARLSVASAKAVFAAMNRFEFRLNSELEFLPHSHFRSPIAVNVNRTCQ